MSRVERDEPSFFIPELEFLVEKFAENSGVRILPKIDITVTDKKIEGNLHGALKIATKKKLSDKSPSKFLILLDITEITEKQAVPHGELYKNVSIISHITKGHVDNALALLCFQLADNEIKVYCLLPQNISETWISDTFVKAFSDKKLSFLFHRLPENKKVANLQIPSGAKKFISRDVITEDVLIEDQDISKNYAQFLALEFYNTRSMKTLLKKNTQYFSGMLLGVLIFSGARYLEGFMVMSLNETSLEASALALNVMRVSILLSVRPFEAIMMLGAADYGARRYSELSSLMKGGWAVAVVLSAVSIPLLLTSEYWLIYVFRQDPQLSKMAGDFLKIYALSMPVLTAGVSNNNILFASDQTGIVALFELGAAVLGSFFSYCLIYGKLGFRSYAINFEPLGLNGLAISLVTQKWVIFLMANLYFYLTRNTRKYTILSRTSMAEIKSKLKLIFRRGLPFTLQMGSEQLYLFIITIYAGLLGHTSLAQANILFEYFVGLSMTGAIVVHRTTMQRIGEVRGRDLMLKKKPEKDLVLIEKNLGNISRILISNTVISLLYAGGVSALFFLASRPLVSVYIGNPDRLENQPINHGLSLLFKILAATTVIDLGRNLVAGTLNGLGDVDSPMLTSILLTVFVGGGLGALLCFTAGLSLEGVFLSSAIAYFMGGSALTKVLHSSYNILKKGETNCNSLLNMTWNTARKFSNCCLLFSRKPRGNLEEQKPLINFTAPDDDEENREFDHDYD